MLNICVLIKPILDPSSIKWGYEAEQLGYKKEAFNPSDLHALQWACDFKTEHGAKVTVLLAADPAQKVNISKLCKWKIDHLILLEQTSLVERREVVPLLLAEELKQHAFDLILSGAQGEDLHEGVTPVKLAELLGLPLLTHVHQINYTDGQWFAQRKEGRALVETYQFGLPALLAVLPPVARLRYIPAQQSATLEEDLERKKARLPKDFHPQLTFLKQTEPQPNIRLFAIPDAALSAEERLVQIMGFSGGSVDRSQKRIRQEVSEGTISLARKMITKWLKEG